MPITIPISPATNNKSGTSIITETKNLAKEKVEIPIGKSTNAKNGSSVAVNTIPEVFRE